MKRFFVLLLPVLMFCGNKAPIPAEQLPKQSKEIIQKHFNSKVAGCLKDFTEYECFLADGTKIEFNFVGTLKEVEGVQLPGSLLPLSVTQVLDTQFKGQIITKIENKPYGFKVKLNNYLKITFSVIGNILNQEYD